MRRIILGCGNEFRGDDAAGVLAARRLLKMNLPDTEVRECSGEGAALMNAWEGFEETIIIDAAHGGLAEGEIREWDVTRQPLPSAWRSASTHSFGVIDAIELGRVMNRLPQRLIVIGIGGEHFEAGEPPSEKVKQAIDTVVQQLVSS
ncbi:MAG: hydrogenase maturation protease [Calditrichota bacterium]